MKPRTRSIIATSLRAAASVLAAADDARLTAILKRVAKKVKIGEYDPEEVVAALALTNPGWTIQPTTTTMQASSATNQAGRYEKLLGDAVNLDDLAVYANHQHVSLHSDGASVNFDPSEKPESLGLNVNSPTYTEEYTKATAIKEKEIQKEMLARLGKAIVVNKTPPTNPKPDTLYATKIKPDPRYSGYSVRVVIEKPRLGVPGWTITAPGGEQLVLPVQPTGRSEPGDPNKLTAATLWSWLYKDVPGATEVAAAFVDSPEERAKQAKRDLEKQIGGNAGKVGHCPVCERLQKLNFKRTMDDLPTMVHHGYERPGTGYIHGDCFAVGYPPFELSPVGCVKWAERLKGYIEAQKKVVANLKKATSATAYAAESPSEWNTPDEGQLTTFSTDGTWKVEGKQVYSYRDLRKNGLKLITIHPGLDIAALAKKLIAAGLKEAQGQLVLMQDDLKRMEAKIASWTLKPLPGDKSSYNVGRRG
jgi:hypothetical protein